MAEEFSLFLFLGEGNEKWSERQWLKQPNQQDRGAFFSPSFIILKKNEVIISRNIETREIVI